MCEFENGFILCSCIDDKGKQKNITHNKKSRRNKNSIPLIEYQWTLYHDVEFYDTGEIGRCIIPSDVLGKGLSKEWILLNLNDHHCFDFEYTPKEGDNLQFKRVEIIQNNVEAYLAFMYKNNEWIEGDYSFSQHIISKPQHGKINPSSKDKK